MRVCRHLASHIPSARPNVVSLRSFIFGGKPKRDQTHTPPLSSHPDSLWPDSGLSFPRWFPDPVRVRIPKKPAGRSCFFVDELSHELLYRRPQADPFSDFCLDHQPRGREKGGQSGFPPAHEIADHTLLNPPLARLKVLHSLMGASHCMNRERVGGCEQSLGG